MNLHYVVSQKTADLTVLLQNAAAVDERQQ